MSDLNPDEILLHRFKTEPVCVQCGSDDLRMPDGVSSQDDLTENSSITCKACGAITTYGAIMESWNASVTDHLTDIGIVSGSE